MGYRSGILLREDTVLQWAEIATSSSDVACTGDTEIDIRNATQIAIQIEAGPTSAGPTTASGTTTYGSDDFDVNVYTRSKDVTTYDSVAYATLIASASSAIVQTKAMTKGPAYMKLKVTNHSALKEMKPRIIVQVAG